MWGILYNIALWEWRVYRDGKDNAIWEVIYVQPHYRDGYIVDELNDKLHILQQQQHLPINLATQM